MSIFKISFLYNKRQVIYSDNNVRTKRDFDNEARKRKGESLQIYRPPIKNIMGTYLVKEKREKEPRKGKKKVSSLMTV